MPFKINFLDHVAIRSFDPQQSASWYENTLGLERVTKPEWGDYPIMMLSRKTGVAIFPALAVGIDGTKTVRIDHFAFNVDNTEFEKARKFFDAQDINYGFQDHHYFHSIYLQDPDGHVVELTTEI